MKILQICLGSVPMLLLIVLLLGSVSAAPLLSAGSNASYHLSASLQSSQSCNATPVSYNQTACGPYQPRSLVSIYDNGTCVSPSTCFYSPGYYYPYYYFSVPVGTTVMWFNYGSISHTVTSSANKQGLQTFDSGAIAHYRSFSITFTIPGNYSYYSSSDTVLRGIVIVSSSPSSPPTPALNPTISLDGSIGWTVEGLDNGVTVLNVSHQVSIVASSGPLNFIPVSEAGSFSQSIDLSTRIESAGTATSAILGILEKLLSYNPGYYGYYGSPSNLGQLLSSQKERYTFWWVNGPLTDSQPVQILTGYSSVTGSEVVNGHSAWIVESGLSQSLSTASPPVITSGGSTFSSFKLDLRFDFDQMNDLLLYLGATSSIASSQTQNYNPGEQLCGPSGCFPVSDPVTVTHHMSATIPITLRLSYTSLDFSKRMPPTSTGNGQSSTGGPTGAITLFQAMPLWAYAGIGLVGVGVVATLAWLLRERARRVSPLHPDPLPAPST